MTSVWDRRLPRVDYRVPVLLQAASRAPVPATTINVSESGVFVGTTAVLDVGDAVTCELALQGEQRSLRGRVAWRCGPADGAKETMGAGIEFTDLSERDTRLLRQVVGHHEAGTVAVRMTLGGLPHPVTARAVPTKQGLTVRAPLPFLRIATRVSFEIVASGERFDGVVREVDVMPAALGDSPELLVHIAVPEAGEPRGPEPLPPPPPVFTERRGRLGSEGTASWFALDADDYMEIELVGDAHAPLPFDDAEETQRTPLPRPPRAGRPIWPWVALVCTPLFAAGAALLWPGGDSEPAPAPRVAPAPKPAPAPAPAPTPPAITVERTGRTTEVVIPIAGSLDAAADYLLGDPDGIAVNLPNARALVPFDDYVYNGDGVTTVRLSARGAGIQVRVHFSSRASGHTLALEPDAVRVSIDLAW